jgi:hypothetical protein
VALDFDLCCTTRLWYYDIEKEKRLAEMMGLAPIANAFGGKPQEANKTFW